MLCEQFLPGSNIHQNFFVFFSAPLKINDLSMRFYHFHLALGKKIEMYGWDIVHEANFFWLCWNLNDTSPRFFYFLLVQENLIKTRFHIVLFEFVLFKDNFETHTIMPDSECLRVVMLLLMEYIGKTCLWKLLEDTTTTQVWLKACLSTLNSEVYFKT